MKTTLLSIAAALALTPAFTAEKKATEPPCCRDGLPTAKHSEKSLLHIDSAWTSDLGKEVKLSVLSGRPVVMAMFFTNCEHSCPMIVADMKAIEKKLPKAVRAKADFLLVSIDPERDTVEALHAFRKKHALSSEHWMLLRGEAKDVKALADHVGFVYSPGSRIQFAHSLLISVLNTKGEIIFAQAGLGVDRSEAVKAVVKAAD